MRLRTVYRAQLGHVANIYSFRPVGKKLARRLIEEQDKVLRSYFAQEGGTRSKGENMGKCKGWEHVRFDIYA